MGQKYRDVVSKCMHRCSRADSVDRQETSTARILEGGCGGLVREREVLLKEWHRCQLDLRSEVTIR